MDVAETPSPEDGQRRPAPSFADWRKELFTALGALVGLVTVTVTGFKVDPATPDGRRVLTVVVLFGVGAFLLVWLAWGRRHGRHGRPRSLLLAAGCVLALAGGLVLALPRAESSGQPPAASQGAGSGQTSVPATDAPPSSTSAGQPGSSTPGPSSSPSGLPGQPPPTVTSTTGSATSSPARPGPSPSTTDRLLDGPGPATGQAPPVSHQHEVTLNTTPGDDSVWMDYWRQQHERDGDLNMDRNGIFTALGAQLTVMSGSAEPDWFACRNATGMTTRAEFSALRVDGHLCARSREGRYARLRVIALPSSPNSNGRFIFYGLVWHRGP